MCVTVRSSEYIILWWAALWYVKFIKSDVSVSASEGTTCCQICLVVGAFCRGRNTTRLNGVCPGEMCAPDLVGKGMRNFQNCSAQSLAACESSWRNLTLWFFISKGETTNERVSKSREEGGLLLLLINLFLAEINRIEGILGSIKCSKKLYVEGFLLRVLCLSLRKTIWNIKS